MAERAEPQAFIASHQKEGRKAGIGSHIERKRSDYTTLNAKQTHSLNGCLRAIYKLITHMVNRFALLTPFHVLQRDFGGMS
jgi:hypothetical protein